MIDICVHVSGDEYAKRFNWMLSSLTKQTTKDFAVSVAYHEKDEVVKHFLTFYKEYLNIQRYPLNDDTIRHRGLSRTYQTLNSEGSWMLYADCDMYYHPMFIESIYEAIKSNMTSKDIVNGADRISLDIPFCVDFFSKVDLSMYPHIITKGLEQVSEMPIYKIGGAKRGAGYFQLMYRETIIEKTGGIYTTKTRKDSLNHFPSDIQFRALMGDGNSRACNPIVTAKQYHLNHNRF